MHQPPPPSPAAAPPPPAAPPPVRARGSVPVLVPQLVWEAILLVLVVGFAAVAAARTPIFESDNLWWLVATTGLLATGLALSLRTGTPNLAVGGIAGLTAALHVLLSGEAGWPWPLAAGLALLVSVLVGLVLGLIAGLTSAPGWAVTLGGLAVVQGVALGLTEGGIVADPDGSPVGTVAIWFGLFLVVSLAGGGVCAIPPVRRLLAAHGSTAGPVRFRPARLVTALIGLGGSSALAGLSGVATVGWNGFVAPPAASLHAVLLALAAVLVGGVSVFSGRGGIAGTVLGTMLLAVILSWVSLEWRELAVASEWRQTAGWVVVGLAVLVGIGVSRALAAIAPDPPVAPSGGGAASPPPPPGGGSPGLSAGPATVLEAPPPPADPA